MLPPERTGLGRGGRERRAFAPSSRRGKRSFAKYSDGSVATPSIRVKSNTQPDVVRPHRPIGKRLRWGGVHALAMHFAQVCHLAQPLRTECPGHRRHESPRSSKTSCAGARVNTARGPGRKSFARRQDYGTAQLRSGEDSNYSALLLCASVPSSAAKPQRQAQIASGVGGSFVAACYGCSNSNYGKPSVQCLPVFSLPSGDETSSRAFFSATVPRFCGFPRKRLAHR